MTRILGILIAVLVIILLIYPFVQESYDRYLVFERLKSIMTAQERAEFSSWTGDATSFARRLYERCEQMQGRNAVQCERYRYPLQ